MSPVNIQILMPALRNVSKVPRTLCCNLSSTPDNATYHHKHQLLFRFSFFQFSIVPVPNHVQFQRLLRAPKHLDCLMHCEQIHNVVTNVYTIFNRNIFILIKIPTWKFKLYFSTTQITFAKHQCSQSFSCHIITFLLFMSKLISVLYAIKILQNKWTSSNQSLYLTIGAITVSAPISSKTNNTFN